jgi:hypothetical protein
MLKIFVLIVFLPLLAYSSELNFQNSQRCLLQKVEHVPSDGERFFLKAYLDYLQTGTASDGEKALIALKQLKLKFEGEQIRSQWIGLFEGSVQVCCEDSASACVYSIGSASYEKLLPRVQRGDPTAIALVLTYSVLVQVDGAEAESLAEFQEEVRKHPEAVKVFEKDQKDLLKKHPIQWLRKKE